MSRLTLVLPAILVITLSSAAQQPSSATAVQKTADVSAMPVEAAKAPNPVKSTPESLARAARWWKMDCEMCHGKTGDGKGETATDMKLTVADFTNPATLKDRTDGELFYIIKNGHNDMPAEGPRVKTEENWDLVNYVRSLANKKKDAEAKVDSSAKPQ